MKHIYFLILVIIFSNNMHSQSWTPINTSDKYNYKINNNDTIACTIFIDSIKVIGFDSIFYLNTVFGKCDTCYGNNLPYTIAYSSGHSQFLKRMMIKNGNQLQFTDSTNFYIKQYSNLNDIWVFDAVNNISALVVNINVQSIFSVQDSIKTILLSTGDTIILSKQFGFIQFPMIPFNGKHYRLVGIEGRNLGLTIPKVNEIFDFSVGSIFQYKGGYGEPENNFYYISQITILENLSQQDTIKYRIEKIGKKYLNPYIMDAISYYSFIDTIKITNNSIAYFNSFTNNLINAQLFYYGAESVTYNTLEPYNNLKTLTSFIDSSGVLIKTTNRVLIQQDEISPIYNQYHAESFDFYNIRFVPGLGQVLFEFLKFEQGGSEKLEGYIINGDTTGNIINSYQLTNIYSLPYQEKFNYILNTETNILITNSSDNLTLTIYDVIGKSIFNKNIKCQNNEVNLSFLKSGIYLIVLRDNSRKQTIKYIKNK